jgi:hypothetical protein
MERRFAQVTVSYTPDAVDDTVSLADAGWYEWQAARPAAATALEVFRAGH